MFLRTRLTVLFTLLFGTIVMGLAVAGYVLLTNEVYSKLDAALQVAAGATAMSAEHELNEHSTKLAGERDLQSVLDEAGTSALLGSQILVCEGHRNAAYRAGDLAEMDLRKMLLPASKSSVTVNGLRIVSRTLRAPKFNAVYQIYAAKTIGPALTPLQQIRIALFLVVPLGLALAALAGYLLAQRFLRPLHELAETVDAVTSSDLRSRVKVFNQRDELGKLGSRFNSLLDRIEEAFGLQRRFMSDASHQIKTPVTVALAAAQVLNRDPHASLGDCKKSLQLVEHQLLQLRRIVQDMFFLSQADAASLKIELVTVYLDDAVSDAVRAAKELARSKCQTIKVDCLPEAECLGDIDLIKQAVLILLDNSVKFTPEGGSINVEVFKRDLCWVCAVTDSGPGISDSAKPFVFDRFFQETRNTPKAAGAGLGLPIAKSIVENHGGTIELIESRPGHTRFEIVLPIYEGHRASVNVHAKSFAVRI